MATARLTFARPGAAAPTNGITLVVFAPFGSDIELTGFPDGKRQPIEKHPLVQHLATVAGCGVHVCALIDLVDDKTWLVEFTAGRRTPTFTSRWKMQMDSMEPLQGLIRHACEKRPGSVLVLGLEGHGAGFMPELDRRLLTQDKVTKGGTIEWRLKGDRGEPLLPTGSPLLPTGSPLLPTGSPLLPANHLPMSTWALGQAIRSGLTGHEGRLGVIVFNNCFNMSVEVLHTVASLAEFAVGYPNYNFFTSGATYAEAFTALRKNAGTGSTEQLARWLVEANGQLLRAKTHHPTIGSVVRLNRLPGIARAVDALAKTLIAALTAGNETRHRAVAQKIRLVLRRAQQYDTHSPMTLEAPDELTDLCSFAKELSTFDENAVAVQAAAVKLRTALAGIKAYGDSGTPWVAPHIRWDFSRADLAMNILCPDPNLIGLWDWRSPFYLQTDAEKLDPPVQPHVIEFLKKTAWVDFILAYHRHEPFTGLRPALIPAYMRFNKDHNLP